MITLLANLALCTLYACWHMTTPGNESQAQVSGQGLPPSALHADEYARETLPVLVT